MRDGLRWLYGTPAEDILRCLTLCNEPIMQPWPDYVDRRVGLDVRHPDQITQFPTGWPSGTDGLGHSDTREVLRRNCNVYAASIVLRVLEQLVHRKELGPSLLRATIEQHRLDAARVMPVESLDPHDRQRLRAQVGVGAAVPPHPAEDRQ